ncbi:cyanophycin synthetase [Amphibiibacter pelophylacis]|uniref:Cyanophycin synthetase n=1 Tax=Amphibiibacter pelophylacis TaxID=1799477 RepID=A0ACC6NZM5_9BURK
MTPLRGPNIWTYRPVIEAVLDIGDWEDCPSDSLPGYVDRLLAWLPGLMEHRCSVGERGGFVQRLRQGTWPAHIIEHVALELQTRAGMPTGFGKARSAGPRGVYKVVIRTRDEQVGSAALTAARDLVTAAMLDQPYDVAATVAGLAELIDRRCLGPSTAHIVEAATGRGIPHIRLNDGNLVQLGHGARQRRIWTAETDGTSAIAEGISRNKDLTKALLSGCGVPVPEGEVVTDAEAAWSAAQDIGLPVAIKPLSGNHARGVSLDLTTQDEVRAAFEFAAREDSEVLVERCIPGHEHRLLVVGSQVVAATAGEVVTVTGDGVLSVEALVERDINSDPRRGEAEGFVLDIVRLGPDSVAAQELRRQGLTPGSVPQAGRTVLLQRTGTMNTDVTDRVHPEVAAMATLAARAVGLDIAGVDLVTPDITRPLQEVGGALVEVNAGPGLLMHIRPAQGEPRPVGAAIVSQLFGPPGRSESPAGRIPVVGWLDTGLSDLAGRLLAWLLQLRGWHTAYASAQGLRVGGQMQEAVDATDWAVAQRALIHPGAEAALFSTPLRRLLTQGLPYDRCQVAVVAAWPALQGLDDLYITEDDQLPGLVRTWVDVVLPHGAALLNADDARVLDLARHCDGEVVLFSARVPVPGSPLDAHVRGGGRALWWRPGHAGQPPSVHLVQGADSQVLDDPCPELAATASPADLLAAIGAAWILGLPAPLLRTGLHSAHPLSA